MRLLPQHDDQCEADNVDDQRKYHREIIPEQANPRLERLVLPKVLNETRIGRVWTGPPGRPGRQGALLRGISLSQSITLHCILRAPSRILIQGLSKLLPFASAQVPHIHHVLPDAPPRVQFEPNKR